MNEAHRQPTRGRREHASTTRLKGAKGWLKAPAWGWFRHTDAPGCGRIPRQLNLDLGRAYLLAQTQEPVAIDCTLSGRRLRCALGHALSSRRGLLRIEGPLANGGSSFGSDMVSTTLGATLSGTGVWERRVYNSGTLAPGVGTGRLSVRDVHLRTNSTLALEILSGTDFDRLLVRGTLTLDDLVNLTLALSYDPVDHVDSFLVVDNDGTDAVQGSGLRQFRYSGNALSELEQFAVGLQEFRISYSGGDGNDVVLYAVPEPATLPLLLAGLPWLLRPCRRNRKITALERESAAR